MKHNIRQRQLDKNGLMTTKIVKVEGELGSGRFDKNGKEIFEGDKVKARTSYGNNEVGVVKFDTGTFMWEAASGWATELDSGEVYELEVVGHAED